MAQSLPDDEVDPATLARAIAAVITRWTTSERTFTKARFELILEARREPAFAARLSAARAAFRERAVEVLPRAGCPDAERNAGPTLALVDGLVINQLLQPDTQLSESEIAVTLTRWFVSLREGEVTS
jgi:hypothetical protein